ncbi:tryptophan synthase subunit alpha [Actinomyces sp. B33]|uniref:tryptophan synthase subunit alpha n=1 Tax=Actinomyces sp. B33 TaxID=2942131 RepID=UPI0023406A06|nr:tryptophan synthase subunit alpha [Actinomyces sp. B33]MDC4233983.1 tryptophan synthase subunit alpha [Actinomyces sp. B33]
MGRRYDALFADLEARGEGAFVPFLMLGDPSPQVSLEVVRAVVGAGADALELGVPFSDPVADGPTIQASHARALRGGADVASAIEQVRAIRAEFPDLPIGMLIYGNVAFARGVDRFYADFGPEGAGADSVLLPDVPVRESAPFVAAAEAAGVDPVFIAPARADERTLERVAACSRGYVYAVSRDGVTGAERSSQTLGLSEAVASIRRFGGPPVLLGFGISTPGHVADALAAGAAGAITGSAITAIVDRHVSSGGDGGRARVEDVGALTREVSAYVASMKAATRR